MAEEKTTIETKEKAPAVAEQQESKSEEKDEKKKNEYLYAVGKRKTSVAQVRVFKKGNGDVNVNQKDYKKYFPTPDLQDVLLNAVRIVGQDGKLDISVKVMGGGVNGQAEAARHGIAKALIQLNPNFRKPLKKAGFLTRDPRKKERKKPGLKRARKAPQWKKR